jgi:membrane-bound lytic murein transglycosylase B
VGPRLRTAASAFAGAFVLVLPVATVLHGGGGDPDDWLVTVPPSQPSAVKPDAVRGDLPVVPDPDQPAATAAPITDPEVVGAAHQVPIGDLSIPATVLEAYQLATDRLAREDPSCGLRWQILAGIGKIESGHANGGRVTAAGDAVPRILGPVLNGIGPVAAISDHDGGRWDGDTRWDRAVGPMQFIPGTWAGFGADGSGDGVADPNNVFDATVAAGYYLCAGDANLTTADGLMRALLRYNHSASYVAKVLRWIHAYDSGKAVPADDAKPGDPTASQTPSQDATAKPTPSWTPTPTTTPTAAPTSAATPTSTPTPTPSSSPSPSPTATTPPTPPPTACPTPEPTPTPTTTPTDPTEPAPTPTPTTEPSPTPSASPSPSPTACPAPTP